MIRRILGPIVPKFCRPAMHHHDRHESWPHRRLVAAIPTHRNQLIILFKETAIAPCSLCQVNVTTSTPVLLVVTSHSSTTPSHGKASHYGEWVCCAQHASHLQTSELYVSCFCAGTVSPHRRPHLKNAPYSFAPFTFNPQPPALRLALHENRLTTPSAHTAGQ